MAPKKSSGPPASKKAIVPALPLSKQKHPQTSSSQGPSPASVVLSTSSKPMSATTSASSTIGPTQAPTASSNSIAVSTASASQSSTAVPRVDLVKVTPVKQGMLPAGNPTSAQDWVLKKLQAVASSNTDFPIREQLRSANSKVLTNHFEITIDEDAKFYEYQIQGIPKDKPLRLKHIFLESVIDAVPELKNYQASFAYDSVGTIIAWEPIHKKVLRQPVSTGNGPGEEDSIWRILDVNQGEHKPDLEIKLKYLGPVDISGLRQYVSSEPIIHGATMNAWNSSRVVNALNIVIGKCFAGETVKVGANKFFVERTSTSLGNVNGDDYTSLCTIRGYDFTIKPGMGKVLLNVNSATSAFYCPITVDQYLRDGQTFSADKNRNLRGVRVYILYDRGDGDDASYMNSDQGRVKTIFDVGLPVNAQTFQLTVTNETTGVSKVENKIVANYLFEKYGKDLRHKGLGAINVGNRKNPCWFAPEDLLILPYQIYRRTVPDGLTADMLQIACKKPNENKLLIELEGLGKLERDGKNRLLQCPHVSIDPHMLQIPCHRLTNPQMNYRNNVASLDANSARWNLFGRKFISGSQTDVRYVFLEAPRLRNSRDSTPGYETAFHAQLQACGVGNPVKLNRKQLNNTNLSGIQAALKVIAKDALDIVVLHLPSKDQQLYSEFKYQAEWIYGFQTICLTEQANLKGNRFATAQQLGQYMGNIAMKANLKMGGINHSVTDVNQWLQDTSVLGADVTHPGFGARPGTPSVAALVGSVDQTGGKFLGSVETQTAKSEIIENLGGMFHERLDAWAACNNNKMPTNVLYYRDGVGKTQLRDIIHQELSQIQEAWDSLRTSASLRLTAVVVTKRHNTRFYPVSAADAMHSNENCKPGTLVDSVVTSPYFDDFYLQSHNGLKGTARSAHYFILQNNMNISTSDLQELTHNLCHSYVRATVDVSYASPAYYADRLCERGRCYLRSFFAPSSQQKFSDDRWKHNRTDQYQTDREAKEGVPTRDAKGRKTKEELEKEKEDRKKAEQDFEANIRRDV